MAKPLTGTLVLSLDQAVAAPLTSRKLADAGARVIKLERPEGDFARYYDSIVRGQCTHFVWLNRGKELVVADLTKAEDRRLFEAIVAKADVLVQNLKPGALAKLGFPVEELRKRYPRLVCCSISGYGEEGPYRERKAYDMLIQAELGLASVTGGPEAPARVGASVVDIATGMNAYEAILEALIGRGRTGEGADIRVSMFELDDGMDGGADALYRVRHAAQAAGPHPLLVGALRGVRDRRQGPHSHLHPERPRVGGFHGQGPGRASACAR